MQGSFEGVESASHAGWMSHVPPSQEKSGCGAEALTLVISKGPALHDCCIVLVTAGAKPYLALVLRNAIRIRVIVPAPVIIGRQLPAPAIMTLARYLQTQPH